MSTYIERAIEEHWGERCEEYDAHCYVCRAWAEYDALQATLAAARLSLRTAIENLTDACVIASEDGKYSREYGVAIVGREWLQPAKELVGET